MPITTKMGQASHLGKWESSAQMIRLVRELQDKLESAGLLETGDTNLINNVVYPFVDTLPAKVWEDVREG